MEPISRRNSLAGCLAGASCAGLLHGLLLVLLGEAPGSLAQVLVFTTGGAVAAGLLAALLVLLWSRPGSLGAAAGVGFGLGLGPIASMILGSAAGAGLGLGLAFAGHRLLAKVAFPPRLAGATAMVGLLLPVGIVLVAAATAKRTEVPPVRVPASRSEVSASGPDVLLISVDTWRADTVHDPRLRDSLPALARLEEEGTWAQYGLSCSSMTVPGHTSMLTGLDAMDHGVRGNYDKVPVDRVFVSEVFQDAGYRTAGHISNGLLGSSNGFARGYDYYDDALVVSPGRAMGLMGLLYQQTWPGWIPRWLGLSEDEHLNDKLVELLQKSLLRQERLARPRVSERGQGKRTTDRALEILDQLYAAERPWFFFLHYMDPHDPYGAPEPRRGSIAGALDELPEEYAPSGRDGLIMGDEIHRVEADLGAPAADAAAELYREVNLEEVGFIDDCIGRILDRVESSGREVVLLLTSDHGEHFGEHGLMKHGNSLFEQNLRVPFYLWGAGVEAGLMLEHPPFLEDVPPTLLDLAGIPIPESMRGKIVATVSAPRAHVASDHNWFSLRQDGWKLIGAWVAEGEARDSVEPRFLVRPAEDPAESRNRLDEGVPAALQRAVDAAVARDRSGTVAGVGDDVRSLADQLGYVEAGS